MDSSMTSAVGLSKKQMKCPPFSTTSLAAPQASRAARRTPFDKSESVNIVLAGIGWHNDKPEFGIIVGVSLPSACNDAVSESARRELEKSLASLATSVDLHSLPAGPDRLGTQHSTTHRTSIFHYLPHTLLYAKPVSPSRLVARQFDESDPPRAISETGCAPMDRTCNRWQD